METKIYNHKGQESRTLALPEALFSRKWNADLVHQVVTSMLSNKRGSTAHTKDRSEVRGGGRKPWKQKGTGRARHGSSRSPIWIGGGVTHGPRNEKSYKKKINQKMKIEALSQVLSKKWHDGQILFVEPIEMKTPKTGDASVILSALAGVKGFEKLSPKSKKTVASLVMPTKEKAVWKSFTNIPSVFLEEVRNLNPVSVMKHKYLIFVNPEASLTALSSRGAKTRA